MLKSTIMKSTKIYGLIGIVAAASLLSCTKTNFERVANTNTEFNNKAQVQFFHATINTQRTIVFMDGNRLSGAPFVYTQTTATNAAYSGSGVNFLITPGLHAFSIRDTNNASIQTPVNFNATLDAKKFYSVFTYDTINAAKQITVEAPIEIPADNTSRIRFANFMYWKTGTPPAVDIYNTRLKENLFSNVPYTGVTDFISTQSMVSDSLIVRTAGTMIALDTMTTGNIIPKRSYTLLLRGRYSVNEQGGAFFPRTLSIFANN